MHVTFTSSSTVCGITKTISYAIHIEVHLWTWTYSCDGLQLKCTNRKLLLKYGNDMWYI